MQTAIFLLQDGDDIEYKDVDLGSGVDDKEELSKAIDDVIRRGKKHLPKRLHQQFQELVSKYKDVFRTTLCNDPAVNVPPMKVEFEGKERPVKVRQRTYSPEQLKFLKKKCDELLKAGFIYRNPNSKWACAPLIVPKEGPERFRFTVDLRPVNAQTKRNVWPMPHADAMLAKLAGATIFFKIDFIHGYWQFPLDVDSQECHSFHTPFGVFSPTRVQHGASNSVPYFQSAMELLFIHLLLLIWLDDMLGYAKKAEDLLKTYGTSVQDLSGAWSEATPIQV